ncbi:hypothetical protein N431DRAFT_465401 [Stipitochalara longipes BDJ]|nr:hypothetical protein N431DRAFT_465401 [Stipitochalara longipes BDJ]
MYPSYIFILSFSFFLIASSASPRQDRYLSLTAVTTDVNNHAILECWRFLTPFKTYPTVGISLFLANTTNITYVILPPRSAEGIHKPPSPMFFVLLSGLARVTFPFNNEELWIREGAQGLIVANDVKGVGHFTEYPGEKESVALQVPFKDGIVPEHEVVGRGACPLADENNEGKVGDEMQEILGGLL